MKKLIFSVLTMAISFPSFPQTSNLGGATNSVPQDTTTSPRDVGFGGALGGANSTTAPTNVPTNTLPRTNQFGTGPEAIENNQMRIQEQQDTTEESVNPMGGSQEGLLNTTPDDMTLPRSPSPSPTNVVPAPGAGTATPNNAPGGGTRTY